MRFIDLFCGIGGFRVALENQGHACVFSSDSDLKAQMAYQANFGDRPHGDITQIHESDIPAHDILCAGFPCQPFSISGNHGGIADPRGQLFCDIIRIARYHRPCIMLLENVKNILSIDKGRVIRTITEAITDAGYDLYYDVINASHYGIPQSRERVYFMCIKKDTGINYHKPQATHQAVYLDDILMDNTECADLMIDRKDIVLHADATARQLKPIRIGYVNKAQQGERIYSTKGHAITIAATTGGVGANTGLYLVDGRIRRLHIDECKQVMGFSKRHKVMMGRGGYKQLGNAVIPPMVERVFSGLIL